MKSLVSLIGAVLIFSAAAGVRAGTATVGLFLNEDDSHFFGSRSADEMTLEGLRAFVDQYAHTAVSHLFLCPNAMKASYRSKARDAIWELQEGQQPPAEEFAKKWCENARRLDSRGLDPYAVWIARCREQKISPWLSMRMNDVHNADDLNNYIHSSFWRRHPEYWRVPGGSSWTDRALDFGIPEVREHAMALIRELLERYDPDGLELDWMRFGYHFRPGKEAEGIPRLTQFMREVRELTRQWSDKRGHPLKLGARVPTHPDAARGLGMDGVAWAREGLVDVLVPTPFWATTDFDIPIELWREKIGPVSAQLLLLGGAEILVRAYPAAKPIEADLTSTRGFAAACLQRGADSIYLFNYMDPGPMAGGRDAYRTLLQEGLNLTNLVQKPRRHVVTYRDTVAPGMSSQVLLPLKGLKGGKTRIYVGPAPKQANIMIVAGLAPADGVDQASFEARLNGVNCIPAPDLADRSLLSGVTRALQLQVPADAVRDGYNEIELRQLSGPAEQTVVWLEVRIIPR